MSYWADRFVEACRDRRVRFTIALGCLTYPVGHVAFPDDFPWRGLAIAGFVVSVNTFYDLLREADRGG